MRIVLDSSVLIAALARPGVCTQLLDEVVAAHSMCSSRHILDEVGRKLRDKFSIPARDVKKTIADLESICEMIQPQPVPARSCRDPNDLPVLGTAVAARAELLITVDKDLLILGTFGRFCIVKPGDFWKRKIKE